MGPGNVGDRFDFRHTEDSQIRFPLMKPVQRIVVGTEIPWKSGYASDGLLEHATQRLTIHNAGMDSKSDDAAAVVIITINTQCVRNIMDSQRNKSRDQRLS